ncbi:hypothetical protein DCC79_00900 [bacterium]|nr:MAG: hypothetical protein DCC79_00900 [bacterium]
MRHILAEPRGADGNGGLTVRGVESAAPPGLPGAHRVALVGVLLGAAALRWLALEHHPPGLHFDEAVYGLMAEEIRAGARPVYFTAYTGREPLYMYVMAAVFAVVGPTALGIRLTSAFIGIATVALAYTLARALHGRRIGLTAAALLAVSYWHVTVSRNGYPNILIPPIEAASACWLWRGWRDGRRRDWAIGGALAGLVLYTYLAARFYPVFLAVLIGYAALVDFPTWRRRWSGVAVAAVAAAAAFAPLGWHFWTHPADFFERANQVLAWERVTGRELFDLYVRNGVRTLQGLVWPGFGDPRWHYNLPGRAVFQPAIAVCFVAGAALSLRRMRDLRHAIPLLWIAVLMVPGILTDELQPAGQRVFGMFPALVIPAAIGLVALADAAARSVTRLASRPAPAGPSRRRTAVAACLVALAVGTDGWVTMRDYFVRWAPRPETAHIFNADYAAMATAAARDLAAGDTVVLLAEHFKHPTVVFLAPATADRAVWAEPRLALPIPARRDVPAAEPADTVPTGTARVTPPDEPPESGGGPGRAARGAARSHGLVYYRPSAFLPDDAPAARWLDAHLQPTDRTVIVPGRIDTGDRDDVRLEIVRYQAAGPVGFEIDGAVHGEAVFGTGEVVSPLFEIPPRIRAPRDEPLVVAVDWAVRARPPAARGFALHLRDAAGFTWAQADGIGYLAEQWRPGDHVRSWFTLTLDRAMPPGRYEAHLMLVDADGRPLPWVRAPSNAVGLSPAPGPPGSAPAAPAAPPPAGGLSTVVADVWVDPEGRQRVGRDTVPAFTFADGLAVLERSATAGPVAPGATVDVAITWARRGDADASGDVSFALTGAAGWIPLATAPIAAGYPPRAWDDREVLRGRYRLRIPPDAAAGQYLLQATRGWPGSGLPAGAAPGPMVLDVGTVDIAVGDRRFTPPAMQHASDARFGEGVRLLGYDVAPQGIQAGAPLDVTLYWQSDRTPPAGAKVFVHLFGPDGVPVAQHDGVPGDGARPMEGWLPGEVVVDRHVIAVPDVADVDGLTVGVGLYDPNTLQRWAVVTAGGAVDDDRLRLTEVEAPDPAAGSR